MAAQWSAVGESSGAADASSKTGSTATDADRLFAAALRHHKAGRTTRAVELYERITRLAPDFAPAWTNLGVALRALYRYEAAVACLSRAVSLSPEDAAAHSNLANALRSVGRLDQAAACHRTALELSPDSAGTHYNLALVLRDSGDIAAAMRLFERAVELGYRSSDLYWDRALAYLTDGDLTRGFAEYEWRWRLPEVTARSLPGSPWKGESLTGRTLFVYAEQGFGDTIQFARYVPMIAGQAGRVVFECQPQLLRLLSGSENFADVELIQQGEQVPKFDFHVALLTLPHHVGTTLTTIPADNPYFSFPSAVDDLPARRADLRVGLAWTGKPTHRNDRNRSLTLAQLAPLLQLPHVHFVSLQAGTAAREIAALGYGSVIENLAPALKDFADTASAIHEVDLVISIDSAVAHLAGALGRPVWTLIPYVPDWRWMLQRDDSPWYPTMHLMRQRAPGDWADLLQRVGERLSHYRAAQSPAS